MRRFILWWLGSWVVITGIVSLAMILLTGPFQMNLVPIIVLLSALVALMVAAQQCADLPNNRRGL